MLKIPFVLSRRTYEQLRREIEGLKAANDRLREKLAAALKEKEVAVGHADEHRRGKERLRQRVESLKKSLAKAERVNEQLEERVTALTNANQELEGRLAGRPDTKGH